MLFIVFQQRFLIFGKTEEVALLRHFSQRTLAIGAKMPLAALSLRDIGLAGHAVPSLIAPFVNIPRFDQLFKNVLHNLLVSVFRRANEVIIGEV